VRAAGDELVTGAESTAEHAPSTDAPGGSQPSHAGKMRPAVDMATEESAHPKVDEQAESAGGKPADSSPVVTDVRGVLALVSAIAAPATIAAAVAFYIGRVRQQTLVDYFGLNISIFSYTPQDYMLRSTDAIVRFLVGFSILVLLAISAFLLGNRWLQRASRTAQNALISLFLVGGAVGVTYGTWRLGNPVPLRGPYLTGPVSLGVGAILLAAGTRPTARFQHGTGLTRPAARLAANSAALALASLVILSVFWAANDYARAQGRERAESLAGNLGRLPAVVVHSEDPLYLTASGVEEELLDVNGRGFHYRYHGLRLFTKTDHSYVLVPTSWSRRTGTIVVLPDRGTIRLEFGLGERP
jgi:hypothetical protein